MSTASLCLQIAPGQLSSSVSGSSGTVDLQGLFTWEGVLSAVAQSAERCALWRHKTWFGANKDLEQRL